MPLSENEINEWRKLMATLPNELASLKSDLQAKHSQNRSDIHGLRNDLQVIIDKFFGKMDDLRELITGLRLQVQDIQSNGNAKDGIWKYVLTLASGVLTAVLIEAWHGLHK